MGNKTEYCGNKTERCGIKTEWGITVTHIITLWKGTRKMAMEIFDIESVMLDKQDYIFD